MGIKLKQKECARCGRYDESIKGLCRPCYWNELRTKSAKKTIKKTKKRSVKTNTDLNKWFDMQITQIPKHCENCNDSLAYHKIAHPRWLIAHILPKRQSQFPEIATHPMNRLFLCPNCHQDFDNKGSDIVKMKAFEIAVKRLKKIVPDLSEKQYERIPRYYKERIEKN